MVNTPEEQFSSIYDEYIQKIYRFVYLKVNSQETAEDITSKVFLKGWQTYREKFQNPNSKIQNIGGFLYKIAGNAVIDYYRQKGRTNTISTDLASELADIKTNDYDKAVLNADLEQIKGALQKIKKEYQDIIIWHYLDDMPVSQIAQLVGKPEGTVRVMLHRGLNDLRQIIQEA